MAISRNDIRAFVMGDMKAFKLIYDEYMGKTYNFVYTVTSDCDLAKDIVQNTFLQLWQSRANVKPDMDFGGYVFMTARNLLYREIRTRAMELRYRELIENTSSEAVLPDYDERLSKEAIEQQILELLAELPESRRNIFLMRWSKGLSNKEIAEKLRISEKTVSTQIHRVVTYLHSKLGASVLFLML